MMIQAISFDFDGTLVDSNLIKESALEEVALAAGLRPQDLPAMRAQTRHKDRYGIFLYVAEQLRPEAETAAVLGEELAAEYTSICQERVAKAPFVKGYATAMAKLASRYDCYINSATPERDLRRITVEKGMDGLFKGIYGNIGHKVKNLQKIAAASALEAAAILHVGDGDDDLKAAREFGCPFVGMILEQSRFSNDPAQIIHSLEELPDLVAKINGQT